MTKEQVKESILIIREIMDREVGIDNPEGILTKLNDVASVLGLSGQLIAVAKFLYNQKAASIKEELYELKAAERKFKMEIEAIDELYLIDETTALNKDLHYSQEALRSMLSYLKQELSSINR